MVIFGTLKCAFIFVGTSLNKWEDLKVESSIGSLMLKSCVTRWTSSIDSVRAVQHHKLKCWILLKLLIYQPHYQTHENRFRKVQGGELFINSEKIEQVKIRNISG